MTVAIVVFAFLVGVFAGALILAIFASGGRKPECPTCEGGHVVANAGDLERDDGYCELTWCPTCCDGTRLGRSDIPIVREADELAKAAEHRDTGSAWSPPPRPTPGPPDPPDHSKPRRHQ